MSSFLKERRKRFQRPLDEALPPFRFIPHDDAFLTAVYQYGEIPSHWLVNLVSGSQGWNLRRLQQLYKHEYLDRRKQGNNLPVLYTLGRRGAERLAEKRGQTPQQVLRKSHGRFKRHLYEHAREICEFRYALDQAVATREDIRIKFWYADGSIVETVRYFSDSELMTKTLVKDSFFGLEFDLPGREPMLVGCILERDRSTIWGTTQTQGKLFSRYDAYWHMWQQGTFFRKYGVKALLVLTVTKSEQRKDNMRQMARFAGRQHNGSQLFWFASATRFEDNPFALLEPIWQTPRDDRFHSLTEFIPTALYPASSLLQPAQIEVNT